MNYEEKKLIISEYQELYTEPLVDFKNQVSKIFPNALIMASVYSGLGSPVMSISFYLIGDKLDQTNRIFDNDPIVTKFIAHLPEEHPTKDTKFKLDLLQGGLYIEPQEGEKWLAMSRVRMPYRKSTGNIEKQVDNLVKYFKNVGKVILDNKSILYKKDIKSKYLEINI